MLISHPCLLSSQNNPWHTSTRQFLKFPLVVTEVGLLGSGCNTICGPVNYTWWNIFTSVIWRGMGYIFSLCTSTSFKGTIWAGMGSHGQSWVEGMHGNKTHIGTKNTFSALLHFHSCLHTFKGILQQFHCNITLS